MDGLRKRVYISTTAEDAAELDELLNRRAAEGWELVTYDYMATSTDISRSMTGPYGRR